MVLILNKYEINYCNSANCSCKTGYDAYKKLQRYFVDIGECSADMHTLYMVLFSIVMIAYLNIVSTTLFMSISLSSTDQLAHKKDH